MAATTAGSMTASSTAVQTMDHAQLQKIVEKAVARQVKPLRKQIMQLQNSIRLHDVLGGLGYILGLTGLGMWAAARHKETAP